MGRLTIGPAIMLLSFLTQEWRLLRDGRRKRRSSWAWHGLGVACVLFWIVVLCEMPLWLYFLSFAYLGAALSRLRSYAEHRYADHHEERTAIVENSYLFGLLFLHNNLHVLHHRRYYLSG
ncbi:fatty acid desaturase (plasmid) [Rhizobium grahamii CCGE 502]|uniref:Fatty acid desaturase n=1 Tax=Rhizobium grahamii CCGE 502 TaxID=990285 RepID=S3HLJ2_9HYPH|nr:fatty acid desaturase [Rhizobium grahamii CCGE 502]